MLVYQRVYIVPRGQGSSEAAGAQNLTMASGFKGFTRRVVGITQSPTSLRV